MKLPKLYRKGFLCLLPMLLLAGCASSQKERLAGTEKSGETVQREQLLFQKRKEADMELEQSGWTKSVPDSCFKESSQPGKIWKMNYKSKDYENDASDLTKTAYIYTPYGYDQNDQKTKYNVLYLMHGWGGHEGEFFEQSGMKNLFDNLIEQKKIEPMIIVSPTFYTDHSDRDFSGSVKAFRTFHQDFENHLMPSVESCFHTWAESTEPRDLKESRDHRAFGGFSLGSVTTWLQLCYNSDYIRYFLPMSGSSWYYGGFGDFQFQKNVDFIEQLVKDKNLDETGCFIYHTTGTNDAVKSQSIEMAHEMINRGTFSPEHYVFYQKNGGYHDFDAVKEYLYNALPLFFQDTEKDPEKKAPAARRSKEEGSQETAEGAQTNRLFSRNTSVNRVINDPAFQNYGRLLFPLRAGYWSGSTLNDLDFIWYSCIDPDKTVEILNTLKERAEQGGQIFYELYSEEEKAQDPSKRDTGLFFFKGKPNEKFAIVNAGGGFVYEAAMHDSFPQALELSKMGYNAFALIYRPGWDTAMEDLARAIRFIFDHADELEVDVNTYSLWGGSAGARMAATLGALGPRAFGEEDLPRPAAVITQYSGYGELYQTDPPAYANVGTRDGIASWKSMQNRLNRLSQMGIDTEFHVYPGLSHGFGLGTGTVAEGWIDQAAAFWQKQADRQ